MELNKQQSLLLDFVKMHHGSQKRKYTCEPYYIHLLNVAELVSSYENDCIEIALCHDLFEDTNCTFIHLLNFLIEIGYSHKKADSICLSVFELTDKYTSEDYPNLNRTNRKLKEAERLGSISTISQTIKYADLIDNTSSIVKHDEKFSKVYLKEKQNILNVMTNGNKELYKVCKDQVNYNLIIL